MPMLQRYTLLLQPSCLSKRDTSTSTIKIGYRATRKGTEIRISSVSPTLEARKLKKTASFSSVL